ncbi:MAG: hypothetical protein Q7R45_02630 [Sulfuricaulis sp.]|nr:hypothetical protein [Sulfuricaulis sp.]
MHQKVITLRKQNFSIYDIVRALQLEKEALSAPAVWSILRDAGFAKLPRRRDEERPVGAYPTKAPVADVRRVDWSAREWRTDFGGLFLFVPMLVALRFEEVVQRIALPGTEMIPAGGALRSLLGLILLSFQDETNNPRPPCNTADSLSVGGKSWQSAFELFNDTGHVGKHAIRKLFFAQFVPEVLLGIEFGGVCRQPNETDVVWHDEILGFMRTGAIQDNYDEFLWVCRTHLGKKLAHPDRVHFSADLPIQITFARTDATVDVSKLPFVAIVDDRTIRRRCPATFDSHHPPKAGLVLKHQTHVAWLHGFCTEQIRQDLREFFFQSSWALGSAFGCRVSGATFRQPWRSNMRYSTVAATGRPILWASAARNGETTNNPPSLACCTQGAKNDSSSVALNNARRRPPQFRSALAPRFTYVRNRSWSRGTLARPTPSIAAVSSKVRPASAGNRTACAHRNSSALCACATAERARLNDTGSNWRGLDIPAV